MAMQMRDLSTQQIRSMSASGLRTFFDIMRDWRINTDQAMVLLGTRTRSTFFNWKRDPDVALPLDTLERISYILGIYKGLQILLPDQAAADAWVRKPNSAPMFHGRSALDVMTSGHVADLYRVRQYIDAMRGGWA
jgi:Antitoxin Xre/MbcA/ParS C-terminal toxin-binding domain/Antitoxin Xre-like helix-turn-helix domain